MTVISISSSGSPFRAHGAATCVTYSTKISKEGGSAWPITAMDALQAKAAVAAGP